MAFLASSPRLCVALLLRQPPAANFKINPTTWPAPIVLHGRHTVPHHIQSKKASAGAQPWAGALLAPRPNRVRHPHRHLCPLLCLTTTATMLALMLGYVPSLRPRIPRHCFLSHRSKVPRPRTSASTSAITSCHPADSVPASPHLHTMRAVRVH